MFIQWRALRTTRRRPRPARIAVLLAISVLITGIALGFGSAQIDPVLADLARPAAVNLINNTVNTSYSKFVSGMNVAYEDLTKITRNEQGQIVSLNTNAELLNLMCIQLNDNISAELKRKTIKVEIPLGSLTASDILSGKGPAFSMNLSQSNTVDAYSKSEFRDAGVNQTEHIISVTVTVNMTVILPDSTETYEYVQSFIVTQAVIVGTVPSVYAEGTTN